MLVCFEHGGPGLQFPGIGDAWGRLATKRLGVKESSMPGLSSEFALECVAL